MSRINPIDIAEQDQKAALVALVEGAINGIKKRVENHDIGTLPASNLQRTPPFGIASATETVTRPTLAVDANSANIIRESVLKNKSPASHSSNNNPYGQQQSATTSRHESLFDIGQLSILSVQEIRTTPIQVIGRIITVSKTMSTPIKLGNYRFYFLRILVTELTHQMTFGTLTAIVMYRPR